MSTSTLIPTAPAKGYTAAIEYSVDSFSATHSNARLLPAIHIRKNDLILLRTEDRLAFKNGERVVVRRATSPAENTLQSTRSVLARVISATMTRNDTLTLIVSHGLAEHPAKRDKIVLELTGKFMVRSAK